MRLRRLAIWSLAAAVLLLVVAAVLVHWASRSETALRWGVDQLAGRLPCELAVEGLRGAITGPVRVERIACENEDFRFEARDVAFEWSPWLLWQERLDIRSLRAGTFEFTAKRAGGEKRPLPEDLGLPIVAHLRVLEIDNARFSIGGKVLTLRDLSAAYDGDSRTHRLRLNRVASDWGALQGEAKLGAQAPLPLSATFSAASDFVQEWPIRATVELSGTLTDLHAKVAGSSGPVELTAQLGLAPFESSPLRSLSARSEGVDLSAFNTNLPRTALAVEIEGAGQGAAAIVGTLRVINPEPGRLDNERLPLRQLDAKFSADAKGLRLTDAAFDLAEAGRAEGSVAIEPGRVELLLDTRALDLRGLHGSLRSTRLAGKLSVESLPDRQRIVADLREKDVRIEGRTEIFQQRIRIEHLLAQAGGAQLRASGEIDLGGDMAWSAQGRLQDFDPARFGEFPAARINGNVKGSGLLRPEWRADLQYALSSSRFRGQALAGSGKLSVSPSGVRDADARLALGGNRVHVKGGFGRAGDSFTFDIDAPRLATLDRALFDSGVDGRLRANGTVSGTPQRPALEVSAQADGLGYDGIRIERWTAQAKMEQADDPGVELRTRVTGAVRGKQVLDELAVYLNGTLASHGIDVSASAQHLRLSGRLDGGWDVSRKAWAGTLVRLENGGDYAFSLTQPARLELAADRALLGATAVRFERTLIALAQTAYRGGEFTSEGSVSGVRAARMLVLLQKSPGIETSLVLGGRWSLRVGKTVDGFVELARESGDVVISGEEALALELRDARLELRAAANRLSGHFALAGKGFEAKGEARTLLEKRGAAWGISGAAPLKLDARATLQSLRPFAVLAGSAVAMDGAVALEVKADGTIADPRLRGSISGDRISIENVENGVFLREGMLRASFGDDALTVNRFSIKGGEGSFGASGRLTNRAGSPRIDLDWTAQKLAAVQHPDLRLTVSGSGKIKLDDSRIALSGELSADRGRVELRSHIVLGADVVVAGRQERRPLSARAMKSELDLLLDLGPDFLITGRGVDARLAGRIRLASAGDAPLSAHGDISVPRGQYEAYGQKLAIDKGVLHFDGPVDNPGIELRAMRKQQQVEAGVEVTGSARNPQVRLVSNPEVPDPEKLSWLVLGRKVESGSSGDAQSLQASAVAMAAGLGTAPLQKQLARSVGVDEISYSAGSNPGQGGVVEVNKRISDKIYVSHQHSLSTATNMLRISYQLSRYWSLRTESGATDALDLFFTFSFD